MGFFKSLFGSGDSTSASEKKSDSTQHAEKLLDEACNLIAGVKVSAMGGDSFDWKTHQKAIKLFKQALGQGLSGKIRLALGQGLSGRNEVYCHYRLANSLFAGSGTYHHERAFASQGRNIKKAGLHTLPTLAAAVNELEKAVLLDSKLGNLVFSDEEIQADLLKLDLVWGFQNSYIKRKNGNDAAISYLMEKVELIRSLKVSLPSLFFCLGINYAEAGKISEAKDMFRSAKSAEDYLDELDEDDIFYIFARTSKLNATSNLLILEARGKLVNQKLVGCEIYS